MALSAATIMRVALRLRDWMLSILSIIILLLFVFWVSAFVYGSFYFAYMPSEQSFSHVANFVFLPCQAQPGKCSNVEANVSLNGGESLLLGQKYSVSLELELPPSEQNRNVGMFLICLEMISEDETKRESCRSALLRYKSSWRELVEALILTPFYLAGFSESTDKVSVEFFPDYVDDFRHRASTARIEIKSRFVDFYRATFRIHAHFSGLRHLMYYYPVFSSCLGICSVATVVFTLLYFFWRKIFEPSVVVTVPSSSTSSLAERQERARELLNKSASQQKILKKVSEMAGEDEEHLSQQQNNVKGDEVIVEAVMGLNLSPAESNVQNSIRRRAVS